MIADKITHKCAFIEIIIIIRIFKNAIARTLKKAPLKEFAK